MAVDDPKAVIVEENPVESGDHIKSGAKGDDIVASESEPQSDDSGHHSENQNDESPSTPDEHTAKSKDVPLNDFLFNPESGYLIRIDAPNSNMFELPVNSVELVQELHQVLMDREETCHRTCFSLQLDGVVLDMFNELKNIAELKPNSIVRVVEEPYTIREARLHVRHVRDLLRSVSLQDAYVGQDGMSLSFYSTIIDQDFSMRTDGKDTNGGGDRKRQSASRQESQDCTPPDYVLPGASDLPLTALHPGVLDTKHTYQCLKTLTFSGWNPPPSPRRLQGDLLYIYVTTLEDKTYHITASPRGFFVNQSTERTYNAAPAQPNHLSHSLIDLLREVSPSFKKGLKNLLRYRSDKHPFERVPTPFQTHPWLSPTFPHTVDYIRAEDAFNSRLGYEEHIPGQMRDWNDELQTARDLSQATLGERILRERALFKINSDFVSAAVRGCVSVVDGNIMSINPGESSKMQMFIWNNIFFSLGFDVKDHYKEFGGDHAAFVAPALDLRGVVAFNNCECPGLYTLGTVVVDYHGLRITAQSIIPGILEKEQEQSVIYGSVETDLRGAIIVNEAYNKRLEQASKQLKLRGHKLIDGKGETVELFTSIECKGIRGNDQRDYILDLFRTFPPDVNFLADETKNETDPQILGIQAELKEAGLPLRHPHQLACLRQELVESFIETRYVAFVKYAAYHLQQLRSKYPHPKEAEPSETKDSNDSEDKPGDTDNTATAQSENSAAATNSSDESKDKTETLTSKDTECAKTDSETADAEKPAGDASKDLPASSIDAHLAKTAASIDLAVLEKTRERSIEADEAKRIVESIGDIKATDKTVEDYCRDIVRKSCRVVGSFTDDEFSMAFNPDVYHPAAKHAKPDALELLQEKRILFEAARFLVVHQLGGLPAEVLDQNLAPPLDSDTLSEIMHARGINMRYLGKLAALVPAQDERLHFMKAVITCDIVQRSAKHVFRQFIVDVDPVCLSAAVAHFVNCLLGQVAASGSAQTSKCAQDEVLTRPAPKRRNRKQHRSTPGAPAFGRLGTLYDSEWGAETTRGLWTKVVEDAKTYFDFELTWDSLDAMLGEIHISKVSMLRQLCRSLGLQLRLRDYQFDCKSRPLIGENDVVGLFPRTRNLQPKASDAYQYLNAGQQKISSGQFREGLTLLNEAYNLLTNIYGVMHADIVTALRLIARLHYIMQDYGEALQYQQRALIMAERVHGIDHSATVTEYVNMALYSFAAGQIASSLRLLYRARYLLVLCHGSDAHPTMPTIDSNIGLILHAAAQFDLSLKFLERALQLNIKFYGAASMKSAFSHHFLARAHSCRGDFRTALQCEKDAYQIYKAALGESHERTLESSECLQHLTRQAVRLQKTVNDMQKKSTSKHDMRHHGSMIPPLNIQTPSLSNIVDTLNLLNGIIILHISAEDVEKMMNGSDPQSEDTPAQEAATAANISEVADETAAKPEAPVEAAAEPEAPAGTAAKLVQPVPLDLD